MGHGVLKEGRVLLYELNYTNDRGESIRFGIKKYVFQDAVPSFHPQSTKHYSLIKFEGFGELGADVQMQKAPFQDGNTHIDTLLDSRFPYVEFGLHASNFDELSDMRRHASRVFNPKIGGVFELSYGDKMFVIDAKPEHVPNFVDEGLDALGYMQTASADLICPNPFWQSPQITEEPAFEPRFHFPFSGPFIMGIQRDQRIIDNDGDAPAPLQIEFFGPAINPKIINNTTGEYIKVNQELQEGERMLIDTTDGQKSVFFVDEDGNKRNVFNWIDLCSTFFKLLVGENDIEYTADSDIQGAIVNISYSKQYVGV